MTAVIALVLLTLTLTVGLHILTLIREFPRARARYAMASPGARSHITYGGSPTVV